MTAGGTGSIPSWRTNILPCLAVRLPPPPKKKKTQQTGNRGEVTQLDKEHITNILQLLNGEKLDAFPLRLGTRQDVHSHHS